MRRWLRILLVGALTVVLLIDSASACRLLRSRCRPRCRVVTCGIAQRVESRWADVCESVVCQPCETVVTVEPTTEQCCVPADGSAHAVTVEPTPAVAKTPTPEPKPAAPQRIDPPLPPLEPVAPASAEKPMPVTPPAVPEKPVPATEPKFKTANEILAESAEQERLEKAAARAKPAEPPMAKPPVENPTPIPEPVKPVDPPPPPPAPKPAPTTVPEEPAPEKPAPEKKAPEKPAPAPVPEEPAPEKPVPEKPAAKKPEKKPGDENLFDEGPTETKPAADEPAPMKKESAADSVDNLFDDPDAKAPAKKPADDAPSGKKPEKKPEKVEDDPFAGVLEAPGEPVRRWIDDTGRHETVGWLVEIRPDSVRILKENGRYTTVPLHRLSRHDQAYVTTTGERLAAQRPARPSATDTAQR